MTTGSRPSDLVLMSQGTPAAAAVRLQRRIADGLESGEGRQLTDDLVEDLHERALDARRHRSKRSGRLGISLLWAIGKEIPSGRSSESFVKGAGDGPEERS